MIELDSVRDAIADIAVGKAVVVVDDARCNGDLVFGAACADPALMAFTVRHTSGFVCVALAGADCERLRLAPMHQRNGGRYRVTVDLRDTGTGISATARARTAAALADATSSPEDFSRPGHVVPLQARPGGVLERASQPEAAIDLARLAGLPPAGVMCTIVSEEHPGELARSEELKSFAKRHGLKIISIAALITYRRHTEPLAVRVAMSRLPTMHGDLSVVRFTGIPDGTEHLAILAGDPHPAVPVYVHNECLGGNVVGPIACACGHAFHERLAEFAAAGDGIAVYTRVARPQLACGTLDGGERAAYAIVHEVAASILFDLGATSLRLLNDATDFTNALHGRGIHITGQESRQQSTRLPMNVQ
ncbi:3,4-dihydroxy-2-butanone-4-phosphate synthase [Amycolatopsis lurida]